MRKYQQAGFVLALCAAAAVRVYLAAFTSGTYDVRIWLGHARLIVENGIFGYYTMSLGSNPMLNHPPLIATLMVGVYKLCEIAGMDFRFIFRLILGASDFLTAALLFCLLRRQPHPRMKIIVYLLAPVTFILSSYHGNTDCLVAMLALASLAALARGAYGAAGFILGLGLSVKWIILLAGFALFFGIPTRRYKLRFARFAALAFFAGYGWWMVQHPVLVGTNVFGYRGTIISNGTGQPIWGNQIILRPALRFLGIGDAAAQHLLDLLFRKNRAIILVLILAFTWLRRRRQAVQDIGVTIAGTFCIFYAATNYWAWQYFAWAVPFYMFLDWKRGLALILLTSAYIYGFYGYFCGSPLLTGGWDFTGHRQWPLSLLVLRDIVVLFFMYIAMEFIIRAAVEYRANRTSSEPRPG